MTKHYTIALDVGRTFVRSALLDELGNILPDSFSIFSSKSTESKDVILKHFIKIIKFNINSILDPNFQIEHIALIFSLSIKDIQTNLADVEELKANLQNVPSIATKLSPNCQYHRLADVHLFAIGEHILRRPQDQNKKVLYLMIGSRLSAAFIQDGQVIYEDYDYLIDEEHKGHIVKDYLSGEGIIGIAKEQGLNLGEMNPKSIAEEAVAGDKRALQIYQTFGEELAAGLRKMLAIFKPDEIVLGGNVSNSYPLYKEPFISGLEDKEVQIKTTEFTSYYIFFGVSEIVKYKK